jgi:uncharacterized membrane protein YadS
MSEDRMPATHMMLSRRWLGACVSAVAFVVAASSSIEQVSTVSAVIFGLLVARPRALVLALVPFVAALPKADGSGEPPDWVAGLFFETPMYAVFIAGGVLVGRHWRRDHATTS